MFISERPRDSPSTRRLDPGAEGALDRGKPDSGNTKHQALKDALIEPQARRVPAGPADEGLATRATRPSNRPSQALKDALIAPSPARPAGHTRRRGLQALEQLACLVWLKHAAWCPSARLSVHRTAVLNGLRADEGALQGQRLGGTRTTRSSNRPSATPAGRETSGAGPQFT